MAADLSAKIDVSCETVKRGAERWLAGDGSLSPSPSSPQVILEEQAGGGAVDNYTHQLFLVEE